MFCTPLPSQKWTVRLLVMLYIYQYKFTDNTVLFHNKASWLFHMDGPDLLRTNYNVHHNPSCMWEWNNQSSKVSGKTPVNFTVPGFHQGLHREGLRYSLDISTKLKKKNSSTKCSTVELLYIFEGLGKSSEPNSSFSASINKLKTNRNSPLSISVQTS